MKWVCWDMLLQVFQCLLQVEAFIVPDRIGIRYLTSVCKELRFKLIFQKGTLQITDCGTYCSFIQGSSDWTFTPFEWHQLQKLTLERSSLLRPDVHIKYASHAHLDLLFDIYCRRIQAIKGDGITVKMGDGWCPWKGNLTSMTWPWKTERIVPENPVISDVGIWYLTLPMVS